MLEWSAWLDFHFPIQHFEWASRQSARDETSSRILPCPSLHNWVWISIRVEFLFERLILLRLCLTLFTHWLVSAWVMMRFLCGPTFSSWGPFTLNCHWAKCQDTILCFSTGSPCSLTVQGFVLNEGLQVVSTWCCPRVVSPATQHHYPCFRIWATHVFIIIKYNILCMLLCVLWFLILLPPGLNFISLYTRSSIHSSHECGMRQVYAVRVNMSRPCFI